MSDPSWQFLITVFDTLSAQVLVERLAVEGIQARVQSDSSLLGSARRCDILVPRHLVDRAQSVLTSEPLSERELTELATGKTEP